MAMSMMDEMAATLARRKAKTGGAVATATANGSATDGSGGGTLKGLGQKSPSSSKLSTNGIAGSGTNSRATSGGGGESPKPARKSRDASGCGQNISDLTDDAFGSTCDDGGPTRLNGVSGGDGVVTQQDLDSLRDEIMAHVTKEINKCKLDIIEAIKMELNRR